MTREFTMWHTTGEGNTSEGTERSETVADQVEDELHVGVVTDVLIDRNIEIAETVAREMTEGTYEDDHE